MQVVQATYHNGVFTPAQPIDLPEGSYVTLWIGQPGEERAHLRPEDCQFLWELAGRRAEVFRRLAE